MQLNIHEINKVVINLPERSERLLRFKNEFNYLFDDTFQVVNGVKKDNPMLGIAEAHLNCIRLAKEKGWDKVLIMEDDLYIPAKEKARNYVSEAFKKVPDDWDIILGGVYYVRNQVKANNYWTRIGEFCALHFYIVNSSCYDKILTYDGTNHIDRWVGKLGLNCYVPSRFFAIQYDGFSDNVKKETNYNNTYLKAFNILK